MFQLKAEKRERVGTQLASLRQEGKIPAEIYGEGIDENVHLFINEKEFTHIFKDAGESSIIEVDLEEKKIPVIVHDIQKDQLGDKVLHIDLYAVDMNKEITTEIPLNFMGESLVAREGGAVLVKSLHEIEIETLPAHLPQHIDVDVSVLVKLNDTIHVKDLSIPEGVKVLTDPETVVVSASEIQEEEPEEVEASEEAAAETPEAEGEKKEDEASGEESSEEETKEE